MDFSFLNFKDFFASLGLGTNEVILLNTLSWIVIIVLIAWISDWLSRRVLNSVIGRIVSRSSTSWDDLLFGKKFFHRLAHFAPMVVIYALSPYVLDDMPEAVTHFVRGGVNIAMIILFLMLINALLNGIKDIYNTYEIAKYRPINGYVQIVRIIFYAIGLIGIVSILIGKSPMYLFGGLSAMAAVLLLVFKDTILGFVASIQVASNDMVRPGDWISFPKHDADGTVTEMNLTTVKVQNWDKTITTIPTYALVSESFSNWRGMEESGGRRIKRSIYLDMNSVHFCSENLIEKFKSMELIKDYVDARLKEISDKQSGSDSVYHRSRKITNIGTFRVYLENYLHAHPEINQEMTFLIRQLQPGEHGIPMEIYVFSKTKEWVEYERIQSDILDHIMAIIPQFELRIFQNPTGSDFRVLTAERLND